MSNGSKNAGSLIVAVLVTLAVAGTGGYMIGNRTGATSAKMETAKVGSVNGQKITQLDLYNRMYKTAGAQTMDEMIREMLVNQEADKAKITVSQADIDKAIADIKTQIGGEEQFQQALAQAGMTMDDLKQNQEFRLKVTALLSKDIPQDEASIKKWFDENKDQFDTRQIHARHILVKTEDEAKAIKAELDKGTDFATLAKEKSIEEAAKESGGDLGTFGPGKMVPEFDKVVFAMKKGETSAPFQTEFGWHVAQVLDATGTAANYDADKAKVKDAYIASQVSEKASAYLTDLQDKAKIENPFAQASK